MNVTDPTWSTAANNGLKLSQIFVPDLIRDGYSAFTTAEARYLTLECDKRDWIRNIVTGSRPWSVASVSMSRPQEKLDAANRRLNRHGIYRMSLGGSEHVSLFGFAPEVTEQDCVLALAKHFTTWRRLASDNGNVIACYAVHETDKETCAFTIVKSRPLVRIDLWRDRPYEGRPFERIDKAGYLTVDSAIAHAAQRFA